MPTTELTADNLFADPYPVYARLRREAPVSLFEPTGEHFVTRFADCQTVGANAEVFGPSASEHRPEARVMGMPNVLSMSGEEHKCLRQGIDANVHSSEIMDEVARLTPSFAGVSHAHLDEAGSLQWPVNEAAPEGSPIMHIEGFVRGKGKFVVTDYVPTDERTGPRFPLLLTTGRILSHYNVGAQTRRTANTVWHPEDLLEMHPTDAENRGLKEGDWTRLSSRTGETTLRVTVTDRVAPGVVYTTFHHPATQANVVTTEFSDWATNCPEYKVTAVQVAPSNGPTDWQEGYASLSEKSRRIVAQAAE